MKKHYIYYLSFLVVFISACSQAQTTEEEVLEDSINIADELVPEVSSRAHYHFERTKNKYPQNYFSSPVDSPILLAGTFCELRTNHFHGGLDIRTGGWEGWSVKSSADGYVSRIKVSPYGYGKAIYITHPNGYTTVYGHLKEYSGAIANYIKEAQYKQRSYEVELWPSATDLPVKKGQEIAISGNTGGSGGPHLHFEIRDAAGQAVNPLLFGLEVKDRIPPQINQLLVYYREMDQYTSRGGYPMKKLKKGTANFNGTPLKVKPGTYAFGLLAKDFFTDTRNKLGINYCWITANEELLYQYQIERMDFEKGRAYNTHIDYYLKYKTGVNYIKLFKEPFNPYPYYKQNHKGEIFLKQGDTMMLKVFVEDYAGLRDSLMWTMIGDSMGQKLYWVDKYSSDTTFRITEGKTNAVNYNAWSLTFPAESFYHDFDLLLSKRATKPNMLSETLLIHYGYTPLHTYFNVSVKLDKAALAYGDKLCAVSFSGTTPVYEGGFVSNGVLNFKTRSFGEYAVYYDNTPPRIRVESVGKRFMFRVSDNLSGISSYKASIDDKWILMEYEPKTSAMFGEIPAWIKSGSHEFKIEVTDDRGNKSEYKRTITL